MSLLFPRASRNIASEFNQIPQLFRALDDVLFTGQSARAGTFPQRTFAPRVDLYETQSAFEVKADLPGVEKDNLSIEFDDENTLVINGKVEKGGESTGPEVYEADTPEHHNGKEKTQQTGIATSAGESQANGRRVWQGERLVGEFSRSFSFPSAVDHDNIQASLNNGILSIVVPKKAQQAAKRIQIQ